MTIAHLVAYTATKSNGDTYSGIAHVDAPYFKPSDDLKAEIVSRAQAGGLGTITTATYLGRASSRLFTLKWRGEGGDQSREGLSWAEVHHHATLLLRLRESGRVDRIQVLDAQGIDRTDHFAGLRPETCATQDVNPTCRECGRDASDSHLSDSNECQECPTCRRCTLVHEVYV